MVLGMQRMRYHRGGFRCGGWKWRRIIFVVVAVLDVVWWLEGSYDVWNVLQLPTSTTCVTCPWEFSPLSSSSAAATATNASLSSPSYAPPFQTIVVLGISSKFWYEFTERRRRHLIRNTWLRNPVTNQEEDEDTSTSTPTTTHRVCSLRDYLGKPDDDHYHHQHHHDTRNPFQPSLGSNSAPPCQLIYTFLFGRPDIEEPPTTTTKSTLFSTNMKRGDVYSARQINHHENDVLFFNVNETDEIGKRWGWFRYYVQTILPQITVKMNHNHPNHSHHGNVLVGFTDSLVLLKPALFWNHPLFATIDDRDSTNHTNTNDIHQVSPQSPPPSPPSYYVYAGLPINQTSNECTPPFKCASLQHPTMMRRFVLLSSPLVQDYLVNQQPHQLSSSSPHFPVLPHPGTYPDVAIANALPLFNSQNNKNTATHTTPHHDHDDPATATPVRLVSLQGTMIATIPKKTGGSVGDYLHLYDRCKDKFANYVDATEEQLVRLRYPEMNDTTTTTSTTISTTHKATATIPTSRPPRLLLGIFTVDSPVERKRRDMIRRTYLRAFAGTVTPNRICSIPQLQLLQSMEPKVKEMHTLSCQLVYTFLVGGNNDPNGLTEWIPQDDTSTTAAAGETVLARSPKHLPDHGEGDIVYLNIRENGKEGKSQTFFHYALSARSTLNTTYYFDYLAKTDSDTLLFPEILLDRLLPRLPFFPHNMRTYVGEYRIKPSPPTLNLGPAYMGGHFYMMSPDLARYITSPACNRSSLAVYSEDQSIGNFIHSLGEPIRRILIRDKILRHPVKRVDRLWTLWKKYRKGKHG